MIGVAVLISQFVLSRLASDQESNLRLLTSAYLDGLSAAVLPAAQRADVWEAFDALDRARSHYTGVNVRFAILELPNGKVLAASDPLTFPVRSAVPADVDKRFAAQDGLVIDDKSGRAWLSRTLREEGFSIGRILAEIDISELLRVRRQVLLTLVAVNAALALGIRRGRLSRPQANARTAERIQRTTGARSGGARRSDTGVEAARALARV